MKELYETLKRRGVREGIKRSWRNLYPQVDENLRNYPFLKDYVEELKSVKEEILKNLDYWIDKAVGNAERTGANVHLARNSEDARKIVREIVGSGKLVVKAKSMVSEELHVRECLEGAGNEVWETDLGEFIMQLKGEKPMHMVIPALHLSVSEVSEVLSKVGIKGKDAEELARGVREFMRRKFLEADYGISGCNAFSVSTSRIFLIENEGNVRLVTSLPKEYIALIGIEKLLPDDETALKQVLLQAAYFGTFPPTYLNTIRPKEGRRTHFIFVDNGRTSADYLREQLKCIRCGRCQLECPVYRLTGSAWGGDVYGGPMGIVFSEITGGIGEEVYLCLNCGKCKEVCPMNIDIPSLIAKIRKRKLAKRVGG